jgi:hypothetical protein
VSTLLLFFDGIGIGEDSTERNPFAAAGTRRLAPLAGRRLVDGVGMKALDATLGVPGLPQSATGQTTLLTGVNAAHHAGGHQVGLPGPTLWPVLEHESLFLKLARAGRGATFANAYTREHLEARRPRWSATTRAVMTSGIPFRMWDEEGRRGAALSHDFTGDWMHARGYPVLRHDAPSAAGVLGGLLDGHDLVLYEYFLTDIAGHRGDWSDKVEQAARVEALVDAVLGVVDLGLHRVVVTSDHGNLEDATHRRHTLNPVPFMVWGRGKESLLDRVRGLEDVTPGLVDLAQQD